MESTRNSPDAIAGRAKSLNDDEIPPAGVMKVSPAFSKAAGSQGRALSRSPQRAESPLETRCPIRVSTQTNKKGKTTHKGWSFQKLRDLRAALFFSFWLIFAGRKSKGAFRACGLDQVPPGRAQGTRPLRIPSSALRAGCPLSYCCGRGGLLPEKRLPPSGEITTRRLGSVPVEWVVTPR